MPRNSVEKCTYITNKNIFHLFSYFRDVIRFIRYGLFLRISFLFILFFYIGIFPFLFLSCFPSVRKESELFADWRENRDKLVTDYKRKRKDVRIDDESTCQIWMIILRVQFFFFWFFLSCFCNLIFFVLHLPGVYLKTVSS